MNRYLATTILGAIIGSGATTGVSLAQSSYFKASEVEGVCHRKAPARAPGAVVSTVTMVRPADDTAYADGVEPVTYEETFLCPAAAMTLPAACRAVVGSQGFATDYPRGVSPSVSTTIERKPRVTSAAPDGGVQVDQACGWYDENGTRLFNCQGNPVP